MGCCGKREPPESKIEFEHLGCACDTWAHLKDQFIYLADKQNGVKPCVPSQYSIQFSFIDAMTYLIVVTDNLTGNTCQYSIAKEFTKESAQQAFERDWHEKEIRHNRGVMCALYDQLEAFEETNPTINYKLETVDNGYLIHKPLKKDLGVVLFKLEYGIEVNEIPECIDNPIELPDITPKIAYALETLIKRLRKTGVKFKDIKEEQIKDFRRIVITGCSYRDNMTNNTIKITYQEMDLNNPELKAYYEYYTNKGPLNGYYNC